MSTAAPSFLLVHSPLVGPSTWEPVASELHGMGFTVAVPSLIPGTDAGAPFWEHHVELAAAAAPPGPAVVAGHSGAGVLLPAVGARLGDVAGYLFVDAGLPAPGRSRLDTLHPALRAHIQGLAGDDGLLPPWNEWFPREPVDALPDEALRRRFLAELAPVPFAVLTERMPQVDGWPDAPCGYIRLSAGYVGEEAAAARLGCLVARIDGAHLEMLVRPATVARTLVDLARRMGVAGL